MDRRYALIEDGQVANLLMGPEAFTRPGETLIDVTETDPPPGLGWGYDGEAFTAPEITPAPRLELTLSKTRAALNETITAQAAIVQGEDRVDRTFTSYVPIFDIDGSKNQLLVVEFEHGYGEVTFSFAAPGIYTLDVTKIRPTPESTLPEPPEIIIA